MKIGGVLRRGIALLLELMFVAGPPSLLAKSANPSQKDPEQTRAAYIARVQQEGMARTATTMGSLWVPGGAYNELSADYKARNVGDTITLLVVEQTQAQSTGDVNSQRAFQTSSGITAPASVPQVMTEESFHHKVVSPANSGIIWLETR